jgi:OOP family OmpA-OmpF porin
VRIAALLAQQPDVRVEVAGHTDVTGVRELNLALSLARANVVRNQLVNLGIDVGRLETAGYGPDRPIADNDTAEGRARNRRVEFRILERTP